MGEVSRKKSSAPSARAIMPAARATSRIERLTYVRDAPAGDEATGVANDPPITVPTVLPERAWRPLTLGG